MQRLFRLAARILRAGAYILKVLQKIAEESLKAIATLRLQQRSIYRSHAALLQQPLVGALGS